MPLDPWCREWLPRSISRAHIARAVGNERLDDMPADQTGCAQHHDPS